MYIESVSKANKKIMLTNIYNRDQQQTIDSVNQTAFSIGVVYLSEASAEYQLASFVNAENNVWILVEYLFFVNLFIYLFF